MTNERSTMNDEQCPDDYAAKFSRMPLNGSVPFASFYLRFIVRLNVSLERVSLIAKERRKQKKQEGQNRQKQKAPDPNIRRLSGAKCGKTFS
jgi:hypothetical protein